MLPSSSVGVGMLAGLAVVVVLAAFVEFAKHNSNLGKRQWLDFIFPHPSASWLSGSSTRTPHGLTGTAGAGQRSLAKGVSNPIGVLISQTLGCYCSQKFCGVRPARLCWSPCTWRDCKKYGKRKTIG